MATAPLPLRRALAPATGLAAALALLAGGSASAAEPIAQDAKVVPGEVVVRFDGESTGKRVELPKGQTVEDATEALHKNPNVAEANANYVATASQSPRPIYPNDPGPTGRVGGWALLQWNFLPENGVNAPQAWANARAAGGSGGRGVKIAVLDTGVAYRTAGRFRRSPDLASSKFLSGYDYVDRDSRPYDENGHGTHVASTIAEQINNGVGLTGLAYAARIMPIRVLDADGAGDAVDISRAIRNAGRKKVDIINLSLEFDSAVQAHHIPDVLSAIRYARKKGAIVVAAAGNEGVSSIAYPSRAPGVISVGSTTEHKCQSEFSNEGSGLDLVAPGGGADSVILSDPNCRSDEVGRDIFQLTFTSSVRNFGYPSDYEGTSMAAPHVAATAALVLSSKTLGPNPNAKQVERHLKRTAQDLGRTGYDTRYGWGMVDAAAATR
ncbi:MAG: S8 family serine peptidase [Solirubrobacterales bacterium]